MIGDFLDRLDPQILHDFTNIHNGEELKSLVSPYTSPQKLDFIIERGKDNKQIEGWIEHILITVKNYVLRGEAGIQAQASETPPRDSEDRKETSSGDKVEMPVSEKTVEEI